MKGKNNPAYLHGHTVGGKISPTFSSWSSMMGRCYLSGTRCFDIYGGRGIRVAKKWHEFSFFLKDMGIRPDGFVLDRIDNNKNYQPGNCRWLSRLDSARNKSNNINIEYNGKIMCLKQICNEMGAKYSSIHKRIFKYNWPIEKAIKTKVRKWVKK